MKIWFHIWFPNLEWNGQFVYLLNHIGKHETFLTLRPIRKKLIRNKTPCVSKVKTKNMVYNLCFFNLSRTFIFQALLPSMIPSICVESYRNALSSLFESDAMILYLAEKNDSDTYDQKSSSVFKLLYRVSSKYLQGMHLLLTHQHKTWLIIWEYVLNRREQFDEKNSTNMFNLVRPTYIMIQQHLPPITRLTK